MNILVSCNDNYLMPLEVMLKSFFDSNPSPIPHQIYMLRSALSKEADDELRSVVTSLGGEYFSILVDSSVFDGADTKAYISKETYFRLMAADYIPKEIRRILWLDADIIVRKSLKELYEVDLEGKWAAACSYGPSMISLIRRNAESLGLSQPGNYFNAGVMLYDLDAIRNADINSARDVFLSENKDRKLMFPGQDLVNAVFDGHVKIVDYRLWNSMTHCIARKEDLVYAKENAAILHFPGRAKPWLFNDIHFADEWDEVYKGLYHKDFQKERLSYFSLKALFGDNNEGNNLDSRKSIKVSVIIPAFNATSTLPRCLDSIIPQLDDSMELIVVDDGSSDGTFNLLTGRYKDVKQLIPVRVAHNRGAAKARNDGLRLSRGRMIAFCDADDEWLPGKLADQVAVLDENPETDIVFILDRNVTDDTNTGSRRILDMSLKDNTFHLRSCLARKSLFDRIGVLDESLPMRDDTEWIVRAISSGAKYQIVEKELDIRHIKGSGLSVNTLLNETERGKKRLEAFLLGIRRKHFINKPLYDLSILIPCMNAEKYIEEAILSCKSEFSTEIIVVDDGSSDESVKVAVDTLNNNGLVGTVVSRSHLGQATSRNESLALARGRWIVYLDADDRFVPGALDKAFRLAESSDESISLLSFLAKDFISEELTPEQSASLSINPEPYRRMLAGCMLCRKSLFDKVGGFDEALSSSETAQWVIAVRESGAGIFESDLVTLDRRYHMNNFGRINRNVQMRSYFSIIRSRMKKDNFI